MNTPREKKNTAVIVAGHASVNLFSHTNTTKTHRSLSKPANFSLAFNCPLPLIFRQTLSLLLLRRKTHKKWQKLAAKGSYYSWKGKILRIYIKF